MALRLAEASGRAAVERSPLRDLTARRLTAADPELVVVLISLEDACGLPSAVSTCGAATLVRKRDFGPALLRELLAEHGN